MTKQNTRLMITGTEGHEDYMVCARRNGYVLGIKPLIAMQHDYSMFGVRLRLQRSAPKTDISNTKESIEGMTKVFAQIPWEKRNEERFSTVLHQQIPWGIAFTQPYIEEAKKLAKTFLASISEKFAEGESFIDEADTLSFLIEQIDEQANTWAEKWGEYQQEVTQQASAKPKPGEVVPFPGKLDDID
jgi:hypothetical protein